MHDAGEYDMAESPDMVSFDHRGAGLSDRLRGPLLPSLEERMDDMRVVLDAAGSDRAVIVAFADGGPLCSLFAATHPERTVALVLYESDARHIAWFVAASPATGHVSSTRRVTASSPRSTARHERSGARRRSWIR